LLGFSVEMIALMLATLATMISASNSTRTHINAKGGKMSPFAILNVRLILWYY